MSKFAKKFKKAVQDKFNLDGIALKDERSSLEYNADDLKEAIKDFQDSSPEPSPAPPEEGQLWKSIESANKRVEVQMQRQQVLDQYWLDQIVDLVGKLDSAEQEGDIRKMGSYLNLLKEISIRTKNSALEKYVNEKQQHLFAT